MIWRVGFFHSQPEFIYIYSNACCATDAISLSSVCVCVRVCLCGRECMRVELFESETNHKLENNFTHMRRTACFWASVNVFVSPIQQMIKLNYSNMKIFRQKKNACVTCSIQKNLYLNESIEFIEFFSYTIWYILIWMMIFILWLVCRVKHCNIRNYSTIKYCMKLKEVLILINRK